MSDPRPRDLARLKKKFHDFDNQDVYDAVTKGAATSKAQNFVVLFGPDHAKVAVDLTIDDFKDLFQLKDKDCPVRWINFWNTSKQEEAINFIGDHYGFSRRLRASIIKWDDFRKVNNEAAAKKKELKEQLKAEKEHGTTYVEKTDLEAGLSDEQTNIPTELVGVRAAAAAAAAAAARAKREVMENFKVIQDSLNYTTTDYGQHFSCFGANWLHVRPVNGDLPDAGLVPPRHWAWFALCADHEKPNTVVSIQEAPNFEPATNGMDTATWQERELQSMRTNTIAVLEQLSNIGIEKYNRNLFSLKSIREREKADTSVRSSTAINEDAITETAASNLFYYLFEDYSPVIPVLSNSRRILRGISRRILNSGKKGDKSDTSTVIQELHELGKDLRQLHHLFSSYKNLFQGIIAQPKNAEVAKRRVVQLEGQAVDRFDRLIDRLQLLMLNTIKEYIDEKTELSSTYFNLTAQKDSQATARLTRSATLLAKLSVFFLPISFITSYFSVQIEELNHYTAKTYWYTFAVVATLSFTSLFFFSKVLMFVSDRLDALADSVSRRMGSVFLKDKKDKKKD